MSEILNIDLRGMQAGWEDALCKTVDPDIFFEPETEAEAKKICSACELAGACLDFAIETNQKHGIGVQHMSKKGV